MDSSCKLKGFSLRSSFTSTSDLIMWATAPDGRENILFLFKLMLANFWKEQSTGGNSLNKLSCKTRISSFTSLVKCAQFSQSLCPRCNNLFLARESHLKFTKFPISSPISEMLFPASDNFSRLTILQTSEGKLVSATFSSQRLLRFTSWLTMGGMYVKGLSLRLRNWRFFAREENEDGSSVSWLCSRERHSKFCRWEISSGGIIIWLLLRSRLWRDASFESSAGMTLRSRWLKFRTFWWFFLASSTIWRTPSILRILILWIPLLLFMSDGCIHTTPTKWVTTPTDLNMGCDVIFFAVKLLIGKFIKRWKRYSSCLKVQEDSSRSVCIYLTLSKLRLRRSKLKINIVDKILLQYRSETNH